MKEIYPEAFPNIDRTRVEIQRILGIINKRKDKTEKYTGIPTSHEERWTPYKIPDYGKTLILNDIHIPYHNRQALQSALEHPIANNIDIDNVLINGDLVDFPQISRFEKDPKCRSVKKDIKSTAKFLEHVMSLYPNSKYYWKAGNHEERWSKYIWANAPVLWDFEHIHLDGIIAHQLSNRGTTDLKSLGWNYIQDQRPIMLGKLPVLHGHELPNGIASPVNPARGVFLKAIHTLIIGHNHRSSTHPELDMFKREIICWSVGCLCGLFPKWQRVNKWNSGFAIVEVYKNKDFDVYNYRINKKGVVRES